MYNLLNLKTNSAKSDIDVADIFHISILSFNKRSSPADYKNFLIPTPYASKTNFYDKGTIRLL